MNDQASAQKKRAINPLAEHEHDLTWSKTREYMRLDFARNRQNFGGEGGLLTRIVWRLMPNVLAVFFYRIARYLYVNGHGSLAMLVSLVSHYITRTELPPSSSIGPGCLIGHATAVTIVGRVGSNFTAYGVCGFGSGYSSEDIGGGPGCPWVGDNVSFAHCAFAQGPIRVGDNVSFGPHAHITRDVPAGSMVIGAPSRVQRRPGAEPVIPDSATDTVPPASEGAQHGN
jgi:serine O-acetyltransferase